MKPCALANYPTVMLNADANPGRIPRALRAGDSRSILGTPSSTLVQSLKHDILHLRPGVAVRDTSQVSQSMACMESSTNSQDVQFCFSNGVGSLGIADLGDEAMI